MGMALLPAKVGSRIAHAATPMVTPSMAMVAATLGSHVIGPAGLGGAGAASVGAGIGGAAPGTPITLMDMIPILTTGVVATGAMDVMLGPGQFAVFAPSLPQPCAPHIAQPILMGSPTVLVHGMQLVRVGDKTSCGAMVCDGVKTLSIGGGAPAGSTPSLSDLAGSLGSVVLGAVLTKTGAIERLNEFGAALVEASEKVNQKVSAAVDKVTGKVNQALDKAQGAVDKGIDKVDGKINKTLDKVDSKVNAALDKGIGAMDKTLDKAEAKYENALNKATGAATGAIDKATGKVTGAIDKVTSAIDKTVNKNLGAMEKTLGTAGNVVDKATGMAGAALGKVGDLVGSVGGALESILGGAWLAGGSK